VFAFYLLNYVAHAATIRRYAGDSTFTQIWWTACALFLPFAGVWRAAVAIANARPFEKDPLQVAKYAGALCMVRLFDEHRITEGSNEILGAQICGKVLAERDPDGFVNDCEISYTPFQSDYMRIVDTRFDDVHGSHSHDGLEFYSVPPDLAVRWNNCRAYDSQKLSCSSGWFKCAVAIIQVAFACITLYRTRGNQVETYGYAAFGLTVIPYAVMSILNLVANLLTPEYPALYMVHSDVMDLRAMCRARYDGIVGTIVPEPRPENDSRRGVFERLEVRNVTGNTGSELTYQASVRIPPAYTDDSNEKLQIKISELGRHDRIPNFPRSQFKRNILAFAIGFVALITPYVLISGLTNGFKAGNSSTSIQRGFVMSWLVIGQVLGSFWAAIGHNDSKGGNCLFLGKIAEIYPTFLHNCKNTPRSWSIKADPAHLRVRPS
jgi:hypothetical protein